MDETSHVTLGRNVLPLNYRIRIEPNTSGPKYAGEETISVEIKRPTSRIRLNAKELVIKGAAVTSKGKKQKASVRAIRGSEEIELKVGEGVSGKASIWISFGGIHNEGLYGFYRSRYKHNGRKDLILTTQFEPADARAAFPCFDEPEFKATFDLSLLIDKKLDAVSNMEIKSTRGGGSKKVVTFGTTPRMSTYLLYIGVGRYDFLESRLGKLKIRVITVPGKKALAGTAMDYAKRFIRFYERYFGIAYPLPKLDLLAIPDFAAGAMENWGALTFREAELICDPKKTSTSTLQWIAGTVSHELTHQWFGDLVTMRWWDDMWLNESFATYMSYKALDAVFPKWKAMEDYLNLELTRAYAADGYRATHPVSQPVRNVHQIAQMFDDIGYRKGGSVLRMLEDYLGGEIFRKGLNIYLKKHKYSNATRHNLWDALEQAAKPSGKHLDVDKIVSYWIDKPGYPVIEVSGKSGGLVLAQKKFTISGITAPGRWPIPINYSVDGKPQKLLMMKGGRVGLGVRYKEWIKLNSGQFGFYRVRYPQSMMDSLGMAIKEKRISAVDAWGIENDLSILARCGAIDLSDYLGFISSYCMNLGNPAASDISSHLDGLRLISFYTKRHGEVERLAIKYNLALLDRLGWSERKGDSTADKTLRGDAMMRLGLMGHPRAVKRAGRLFQLYKKGVRIDPNLKNATFMSIAAWGGKREFDELAGLYKKAWLPMDQRALLWSLSEFKDVKLLKKVLAFSFSKSVRLEDSPYLPELVSRNPVAAKLMLGWITDNWSRLMKLYPPSLEMLVGMVEALGLQHDDMARARVVRLFSKSSNRRQDIELAIKQVIETIDANIRFIKRNG